ncbi:hypothetical protein F4809DRAFT_633900 [Biscogniauxia mediterranea]|nr:hypothetical protein F4809DRAFT_633900 [Biscogniauxia mediterranea]
MAEVFGLVTGIAGLVQISSELMRKCCHYIGSVRGAPDDMRSIKDQVSTFQTELLALESFISTHTEDISFFQHLGEPGGAIREAYDTIEGLLRLLGPKASKEELDGNHIIRGLARLSLDDLKWPLKERKAQTLLTRLEAHKSSLTIALNTGHARNMQVIRADIREIKDDIRQNNASLDEIDRRNMLKWLFPKRGEMRNMHAGMRELQEPNTCAWMTREDAWKQWLNKQRVPGQSRFIWIHGIPGAGKTVLASYLIERAANACHTQGCAYYYCLHSRRQDETLPMLKCVVGQLSQQAGRLIPTKLQEAYKADRVLSIQDLLDCLGEISRQFERVYIIVDAVDESQPRDVLLKTLSEIGTSERFCQVSLLFTSREEHDIIDTIADVADCCSKISMSNKNVRDDIKAFIHGELERGRPWKIWDTAFLNEIEDRLVQEARGMFRWAVCQLDVLKSQRSKEGILETLRTLPKDIFATYERILTNIPERDKEFARTALALICSNTSEIPTAEILVAACLYNVPYGDIGNYTVQTLHDICGCLIHLKKLRSTPPTHFNRQNEDAKFHQVALAHYTVKEYLFYPGTAEGPAKFFALSRKSIRNTDLMVIFNGLRHFGAQRGNAANAPISRYEEYCLRMTEKALKYRRADILGNEELRCAVMDSLTPEFRHLVWLRQSRGIISIMRHNFPRWNSLLAWEVWPPNKITGTLANLILLGWLDLAEKYLETSGIKEMRRSEAVKVWTTNLKLKSKPGGTLLDFCIRRRGAREFLQLFIRFGATFEHENEILYTAMSVFCDHDANGIKLNTILKLLLGACANPNPVPSRSSNSPETPIKGKVESGFVFTPLQLAVHHLEPGWVETLLEECADANGRGTRNGVFPSTFFDQFSDFEMDRFQNLGQQTPLEICATTQPEWSAGDTDNEEVRKARQTIEGLLKRYGAKESITNDCSDIVIDLVDEYDEGDPVETNLLAPSAAQTTGQNKWRQAMSDYMIL